MFLPDAVWIDRDKFILLSYTQNMMNFVECNVNLNLMKQLFFTVALKTFADVKRMKAHWMLT